jgi:hypothetical protein
MTLVEKIEGDFMLVFNQPRPTYSLGNLAEGLVSTAEIMKVANVIQQQKSS